MNICKFIKEVYIDFFGNNRTSKTDHENYMKLMQWGSYSDVTNDLNKDR